MTFRVFLVALCIGLGLWVLVGVITWLTVLR